MNTPRSSTRSTPRRSATPSPRRVDPTQRSVGRDRGMAVGGFAISPLSRNAVEYTGRAFSPKSRTPSPSRSPRAGYKKGMVRLPSTASTISILSDLPAYVDYNVLEYYESEYEQAKLFNGICQDVKEARGSREFSHILQNIRRGEVDGSLDLNDMNVDDEMVRELCEALRSDTKVEELWLGSNNITATGAQAIGGMISHNKTIVNLSISQNEIGDKGCEEIAEGLQKNTTLKNINLSENEIGIVGAEALANMLDVNQTIATMSLCKNYLESEGCEIVFDALYRHKSLKELNIRYNHIGDEGAKAVAAVLRRNRSLQKIVLSSNIISEEGARAIITSLEKNCHIKALDMTDNPHVRQWLLDRCRGLMSENNNKLMLIDKEKRLRNDRLKVKALRQEVEEDILNITADEMDILGMMGKDQEPKKKKWKLWRSKKRDNDEIEQILSPEMAMRKRDEYEKSSQARGGRRKGLPGVSPGDARRNSSPQKRKVSMFQIMSLGTAGKMKGPEARQAEQMKYHDRRLGR